MSGANEGSASEVAIVTGGAQGIGLAAARKLAERGSRIAIWDMDGDAMDAARDELGGNALALHVDITDAERVVEAARQTEEALGPITQLVHSAGIAGANAPVTDYPLDEWRRIIDIDLNGTFYVNRAVAGRMVAHNYGRICNIASIAGKEGNPNASAYSAAKAGVIALTKALGKELSSEEGGRSISVNCITPAAAKTRIFEQMTDEHIAFMLSKVPRARFMLVEEAADMIAWIVSRENAFTTGAVFDISGGRATY